MADSSNPALAGLNALVGDWTTEMSHPAMPGVVARGTVFMRWLEGERFLVQRSHTEHADFPDFVAVIGVTEEDRVDEDARAATAADDAPITMHYFDSRGVFRVYRLAIEGETLRIWRDAPGFSQRFRGAFQDGGATLDGRWEVSRDETNWKADVQITYRRQ